MRHCWYAADKATAQPEPRRKGRTGGLAARLFDNQFAERRLNAEAERFDLRLIHRDDDIVQLRRQASLIERYLPVLAVRASISAA